MSFEEFEACIDGYNKANSGGKRSPKDITDAEFDEAEKLLEEVERRNAARKASNGKN